MSELKELKRLKDEERTLMNVASKLSDQLNRLKVEELALLSMLHKEELPNRVELVGKEEEKKETQPSSSQPTPVETEELVPLDLSVNSQQQKEVMEEEEEEEDDDLTMMMTQING
ncbi:snRNA-activating protein complex subunit 5-like [Ostrea edulis]|uniref:snRNA-activating protein complex subunit 5-like n=1 Tax=Ostrea edulis TaxID=37623 RepID=UPI0024AEE83D|nr:snRNA-activating protein complex subunit 5-like [Ostrea edulis]XP_048729089.2 snRNA-activating protein complex subunit 5-like [Ostrea edulis]XP_055998394.1 snRNA-activating protein complex subunit 5-like [Ostrea edulis]XP_055998395.1 snRNA-activating protein complex subunit 5-like [Ostrea edulis]XP_055998396.1 snRNA-activating protein complex subunit 5-like [Ostrea edulis]